MGSPVSYENTILLDFPILGNISTHMLLGDGDKNVGENIDRQVFLLHNGVIVSLRLLCLQVHFQVSHE